MADYEPGVCNIGRAEQKKRYGLGAIASFITMSQIILILIGFIPRIGILTIMITSIAAFEGFFQGYMSFCAGFASKGIYDVSEDGDEKKEVEEKASRRKDKNMARQIHLYSLTGALSVTALVYLGLTIL